ncbi:MAG TPA: FMN reductase [Microscillaceae bacterium]|nr:FMN reductase [Microscillaceae bacterium]
MSQQNTTSQTVIIQGSARNDGNTAKIVQELRRQTSWDVVDLNDHQFSYYDYAHQNQGDDFLPLMRNLIAHYETFVFATPVYWYSMSGLMKTFFDRITDLLTIEKPLGRQLRGKSMAVISSSGGSDLGEAFWLPFSESAQYLGMHYLGNTHTYIEQDNTASLTDFVQKVTG